MPNGPAPAATFAEAAAIVTICFGWFILGSIEAVATGFPVGEGFSAGRLEGLIASELVLGAVALVLLRRRGYLLAELLPTPSWHGCAVGVALFCAATFAWWVVALAYSATEFARQPVADMMPKSAIALPLVIALGTVNALYEETFLVGYLIRGFRASGATFAIGLSLLVRVLYHLYQGPIGAVSVLVFGLVLSFFYWWNGRLWPVVFAHALADVVAFA